MLYEIRALLALVITFSLLAPVSAKTDYCHQARPQAYLTHEDMISVAKGIYLVQADRDQVGFEEETPETIEDTRPHALDSTTDVSNDNEETAPVIPNFKSEVRRSIPKDTSFHSLRVIKRNYRNKLLFKFRIHLY